MLTRLFTAVLLVLMPIAASAQQPAPPREQPTVVTAGEGVVPAGQLDVRARVTVTSLLK